MNFIYQFIQDERFLKKGVRDSVDSDDNEDYGYGGGGRGVLVDGNNPRETVSDGETFRYQIHT